MVFLIIVVFFGVGMLWAYLTGELIDWINYKFKLNVDYDWIYMSAIVYVALILQFLWSFKVIT